MTRRSKHPRVFISYAHEDEQYAITLYQDLKEAGAKPWIDSESLPAGAEFEPYIRRAIESSDFFIALMSSRSVGKTGFVQREIRKALDILKEMPDGRIFVIPARLDNCQPSHDGLKRRNRVDLFPHWEDGMSRLVRTILGTNTPFVSKADVGVEISTLGFSESLSVLFVGTRLGDIYAFCVDPTLTRVTEFQAHEDAVTGIAVFDSCASLVTVARDGSCRSWSLDGFPKNAPARTSEWVCVPEAEIEYRLECRSVAANKAQTIAAVAVGPEAPEQTTDEDWNELNELEDKYARVHLLSAVDLSEVTSFPAYEVSACGFASDDLTVIVLHRQERVTVVDTVHGRICHDLDYGQIHGVTMGGTDHMAIACVKNLLAINYIAQSGPALLKIPRLQRVRAFTVDSHKRGWRDGIHAGPLAFDQDGKRLVIGYSNGDVAGWRLDHYAPVFVTTTGKAGITALGFLPEGNRVVAGNALGELSTVSFRRRGSPVPSIREDAWGRGRKRKGEGGVVRD